MTPAREPGSPLTVLTAPPEGGAPVTGPMTGGPGLYEVTEPDGTRWITNVTRRISGRDKHPGRGLINTAAGLLAVLDGGLFAVSLAAQYQYIFHAKHQSWPAVIEAVALDAGMVIFSLLALGLARGRQAAPVERALIVVCALGSAAMNYGAADVSSLRSVAAYVMPPVFLAIVTDRVIAVVRRHMLGMEAERSAWAVIGHLVLAVLAAAGKAALYGLRLVLAPRSTLSGARSLVLIATPLPGTAAVALALDPVRAALDEDLRELRDRYAITAANLDDSLRAAQEASRTEIGSVREAVRTEIQAVREAARTEAGDAARAALGTVRAALGEDLRELRERHEQTATLLGGRPVRHAEGVPHGDRGRTGDGPYRGPGRTGGSPYAGSRPAEPPAVDRDAVVAELADQIRDAISSGEQWTPDYDALMTRTRYRRSWCEKAVRDARTAVFDTPDTTGTTDGSPS